MRAFQWIEADDTAHSVYAYTRQAGSDALLIVLNLSDQAYPEYTLRMQRPSILRELVNSDSIGYGGEGMTNERVIYSVGPHNEVSLTLAPFGSCILRITG